MSSFKGILMLMRTLFAFIFIGSGLVCGNLFSQSSIIGKVLDSDEKPLISASIILMSDTDSVMVGFGITDGLGRFRVDDVSEGTFLLQSSYIGHLDDYREVRVEHRGSKIEIPDIILQEGQMKLDEVVITADYVPVSFNKDTIKYNAAAFNVKANEMVEDLLKKLPGVEVGKDGSIKAQGEQINKVLVEGKEFFGNDPTIATRNLPADAVDKVEVFDKKSDIAEFSGIDDGMEQKTINLSLKEDRKKGFFGNGKLGLGSEDRYNSKFNVNSFKGDATWTGIGMANNINEQGFSVMDYIDFMGGLGNMGGSGGRIEINSDDVGIGIGQDIGQGFVNTLSGGLNYNLDVNKKSELSGSYFYSSMKTERDRRVLRESVLQNESYRSLENTDTENNNSGHTLNLKYKSKLDSTQRINIGSKFNLKTGSSISDLMRSLSSEGGIENETMSSLNSDRERMNFELTATYNRRLKKSGRIFSINGMTKSRGNQSESLINSLSQFYSNGNQRIIDILHQRQLTNNNFVDYQLGMSYTEPLGKARYLEVNFNRQNISNRYSKDYFDILGTNGERQLLNERLSDLYNREFVYNRLGTNFKINRDKYNLTLGVHLQHSDQIGTLETAELTIEKEYLNLLPSMILRYETGSTSNLMLAYQTNIREPSLQQLQPQVDNNDPLYIYIGNPDLRPEYTHNINLRYNSFNSFADIMFFGSANLTYTNNKITNSQNIDENFVQTVTPVNIDNHYSLSSYFSLSLPIRPLGLKTELSTELGLSKSLLFINQIENNTNAWSNNYTLTLENRKKKNYDARIGVSIRHNGRHYSESDHLDQSFFSYNYFSDVSKDFGDRWRFKTSIDYNIYPSESFGEAANIALWQASLSMNFLKNQRGQLTISAVDIFNQNKGINRTTNLNYFQEETVLSLGRYVMMSFGYSFSGFAKKNNAFQIATSRRR